MKKYRPNRKSAIALNYDEEQDQAPHVVAKGEGLIAEEIINRASEAEVPVYEDETLVQLMNELNINESIPEDLYQAVAEVFAFIYQSDQKYI
ncbi:EscU/YscU/HrcU family type III secretion system export apparatus switch protein [Aquisalibacillus elongatus]|uniref:Flagellar biosynthesis protein n=1 Tax=Aquisalibacillus elongatus TaxID=485577 RepID=A0A3N5BLG2_9BACI|nr:EscU/YscU/HrcU family type III secretion system export apparatus switch protein [Aquisalibacillus elongatus]RPF56010.1 flagellar biosynthesis protein [Aquisalibacillus elongatus]